MGWVGEVWVAKGRQGRQGFGVVGGVGWGEGCVGEGVCLCVCVIMCASVYICVYMCIYMCIYTQKFLQRSTITNQCVTLWGLDF